MPNGGRLTHERPVTAMPLDPAPRALDVDVPLVSL